MGNWISLNEQIPIEGIIVETRIEDEHGVRNEQDLVRKGCLFFFPDYSMHIYYTPTHWRPKQNEQ